MKQFTVLVYVFVVLLVTMFSPQSQKEYDWMVRVMEERYRRLLGLEDGVLSEYLFIAFCTKYAQDNEDRYRQLQQFIQLRNLAASSLRAVTCPICNVDVDDDQDSLLCHVRDVHSHEPNQSGPQHPIASSSAMTRFNALNSPSHDSPLAASASATPQPSASAAAVSPISPIVFRIIRPSYIDTQLFTPPALLQSSQDVSESEHDVIQDTPPQLLHSEDVIILDTPHSVQDMFEYESEDVL